MKTKYTTHLLWNTAIFIMALLLLPLFGLSQNNWFCRIKN